MLLATKSYLKKQKISTNLKHNNINKLQTGNGSSSFSETGK